MLHIISYLCPETLRHSCSFFMGDLLNGPVCSGWTKKNNVFYDGHVKFQKKTRAISVDCLSLTFAYLANLNAQFGPYAAGTVSYYVTAHKTEVASAIVPH